jgi:hypothetical protein
MYNSYLIFKASIFHFFTNFVIRTFLNYYVYEVGLACTPRDPLDFGKGKHVKKSMDDSNNLILKGV